MPLGKCFTAILVFVLNVDFLQSRPVNLGINDDEVLSYLAKYGYLNDKTPRIQVTRIDTQTNSTDPSSVSTPAPSSLSARYSRTDMQKGLSELQTFFGLPATGKLDSDTVRLLQTPRCGQADRQPGNESISVHLTPSGKRKIRSGLADGRQNNQQVTMVYSIPDTAGPPAKLASNWKELDYITIDYAFNIWASVTNLKFLRHTKAPWMVVDIYVMFYSGDHGDGMPFGNGKDLGHVVGPRIHLDYDANWEVNQWHTVHYRQPSQLNDYVGVLAHELGHVLGLKHTSNNNSIMFPTRSITPNADYVLHTDDMQAIQNLYGTCLPDRIDAVESFPFDGKTYFFIGPFVYRFNDRERRVDATFPMLTQQYWGMEDSTPSSGLFPRYVDSVGILPCCPSPLDYNWFIFLGDQAHYYYTPDGIITNGWPADISTAFTGVNVKKIDASMFFSDNKMYLFSGDLVYRWDHTLPKKRLEPDGALESGWPRKIKDVFPGVPDNIDAAFRRYYDGKTYFFKGKYFYIWNEKTNKADCCFSIKQWQNLCDVFQYDMSTRKSYSIAPREVGP